MKSLNGVGYGGEDFDPTELPDEPEKPDSTTAAPAPGLPISEEEYRRLKEKAEHAEPRSKKERRSKKKRKD